MLKNQVNIYANKTKTKTTKKEKGRKKGYNNGFEPRTFGLKSLHLTTTLLSTMKEIWRKVFDLSPFPRNFRRQTTFKTD